MQTETEEQRAQKPCFVGYAACGHMVACSVDEPERKKDNAKLVASWVRDGLTIGTRTVAEVRTAEWCGCKRAQKKAL